MILGQSSFNTRFNTKDQGLKVSQIILCGELLNHTVCDITTHTIFITPGRLKKGLKKQSLYKGLINQASRRESFSLLFASWSLA